MPAQTADRTIAMPEGLFSPVAGGVGRLCTVFVNLYAVDLPDGSWVLVDTGIPGFAWYVRKAVESRYVTKPRAIVLTHGHFDHAGNAKELAEAWDLPIYAHKLELPYLTAKSDYAPQDPTPGGAICFLSRFFPTSGTNLGSRVRPLPDDGSIPPMPGWKWVHTPGHSQGHVSLFREADSTLLAGDAIATTDLDAWSAQFTWPREISRRPRPSRPTGITPGAASQGLRTWSLAPSRQAMGSRSKAKGSGEISGRSPRISPSREAEDTRTSRPITPRTVRYPPCRGPCPTRCRETC